MCYPFLKEKSKVKTVQNFPTICKNGEFKRELISILSESCRKILLFCLGNDQTVIMGALGFKLSLKPQSFRANDEELDQTHMVRQVLILSSFDLTAAAQVKRARSMAFIY